METPLLRALSAQSCALEVRAQPGAKRGGRIRERDGKLELSVRAPARDGRANAELVEVLADALGLKRSEVEILRGERGRTKQVAVALPIDEARRRLREHLARE